MPFLFVVGWLVAQSSQRVAEPLPATQPVKSESAGKTAEAKPFERFGGRHQLVTAVALGITGSYTGRNDNSSAFSISAGPAFDFFVVEHLSLGASARVAYSGTRSAAVDVGDATVGIGPRIGYDVPLGQRLSLWPQLGVRFDYVNQTVTAKARTLISPSTPYTLFEVSGVLTLPLVIVLAPHVYWSVGPYFEFGTESYQYPATSSPVFGVTAARNGQVDYFKVGLENAVGGFF